MIKNKLVITAILGVTLGLGIALTTGVTAKATIKDSLAKYEKDSMAIQHIDIWLNSPLANPSNSRYDEKTLNHMKIIKAYLTSKNKDEKEKIMNEINTIEKEQRDEKAFYNFFKENRYLTKNLQDKSKELFKQGKSEEARLYINKRMDLMKELYKNKDKYKNPRLIDLGLDSYWEYDR